MMARKSAILVGMAISTVAVYGLLGFFAFRGISIFSNLNWIPEELRFGMLILFVAVAVLIYGFSRRRAKSKLMRKARASRDRPEPYPYESQSRNPWLGTTSNAHAGDTEHMREGPVPISQRAPDGSRPSPGSRSKPQAQAQTQGSNPRVESKAQGSAFDLSRVDELLEDIEHDHDPENGFPAPDKIPNLIRSYRLGKRAATGFLKFILLTAALYSCYWILTSIATIVTWIALVIFWGTIFVALHVAQPILMVGFWAILAATTTIFYFIPYRIMRKRLIVDAQGRYKTLGVAIFIRGSDEWGNAPQSTVYPLWYGWRRLKHAIRQARGRTIKPWEKVRPTPHEIPFGSPYYLRGGKIHKVLGPDGKTMKARDGKDLEKIDRFRYAVTFKDNTKGRIAGMRRPSVIFVTGKVETRLFAHHIIGDGFKVDRMARKSYDDVEHFELLDTQLRSHPRQLSPYLEAVRTNLNLAAGNVELGVYADPDLSKETTYEYTQPAGESYYLQLGYEFDEHGNMIAKPNQKEKKPPETPTEPEK